MAMARQPNEIRDWPRRWRTRGKKRAEASVIMCAFLVQLLSGDQMEGPEDDQGERHRALILPRNPGVKHPACGEADEIPDDDKHSLFLVCGPRRDCRGFALLVEAVHGEPDGGPSRRPGRP